MKTHKNIRNLLGIAHLGITRRGIARHKIKSRGIAFLGIAIFGIAQIALFPTPTHAKEPTSWLLGVGIGAGQSEMSIEHLHAARYPLQRDDGSNQIAPQRNSHLKSWALAWEFLLGYKHFINDFVGFRYHANIGVQHYKPSLFKSATQPIGFADYTLNADLLINFWTSDSLSLGIFGGIGIGGTSFDEGATRRYMSVYSNATGEAIGHAKVQKHFVNVNTSVGARLIFFQKIRRTKARVCDDFINGRRACRVPVFFIGHSIEFGAKFPLLDYRATQSPDIVQDGAEWVSRPAYRVRNPYRLTMRYVVEF